MPEYDGSDLTASMRVPLAGTQVKVSRLGLGGTPFGNLFVSRSDEDLQDAFEAAWAAGVRYFDTAPQYGGGLSELRLGRCLAMHPRDAFTVSTKVGKLLQPSKTGRAPDGIFAHGLANDIVFDYSYDATLRSLEESLQRLGLDRVDIVLVHDLNRRYHGDAVWARYREALDGAFRALSELRSQGVVGAIGAGNRELDVNLRLIQDVDIDCIMLPGGYTLLDRAAATEFLPACAARGVSVVIAGPFESGILVTGPTKGATYNYAPAPEAIMARASGLDDRCREAGIPLAAAALQFPFTDPAVAAVVVGMASRREAEQTVAYFNTPIDEKFWAALVAAPD